MGEDYELVSETIEARTLVGLDYRDRRWERFTSIGSTFEGCSFRGTFFESASFGAGISMSVFERCDFTGSTISMGPAGRVRFRDCDFSDASIKNWFCHSVEVINCTFSGTLTKVVFNGAVPAANRAELGRASNAFEGNDFSRASLKDVAFRTGIDLRKQKFSLNDVGAWIVNADDVARLRSEVDHSPAGETRRAAELVLNGMEEDLRGGQEELFIQIMSYPRRLREVVHCLLKSLDS